MGAKFKSKPYIINTFFDFLHRFLCVWLKRLKKAEFHADFKSVKKVFKNAPKKLQAKQV
jgi:hypothetical protein